MRIFLTEGLRQHDIAGTGIGFGGCFLGEVEDVAPITCGLGIAFLFHIDEIYYEVLTVIHREGSPRKYGGAPALCRNRTPLKEYNWRDAW